VSELLERDSQTSLERESDAGPPVAHIAPRGVRIALCGAEILGIPVGRAEYVLCEECKRLRHFDYHPTWDGGS
jgi:hypothetical protein